MTDTQDYQQLKRRVVVLEGKVDKVMAKIPKYDEAYSDYIQGKKWILRLGIATLISAALSPHLTSILKWMGFLKP